MQGETRLCCECFIAKIAFDISSICKKKKRREKCQLLVPIHILSESKQIEWTEIQNMCVVIISFIRLRRSLFRFYNMIVIIMVNVHFFVMGTFFLFIFSSFAPCHLSIYTTTSVQHVELDNDIYSAILAKFSMRNLHHKDRKQISFRLKVKIKIILTLVQIYIVINCSES